MLQYEILFCIQDLEDGDNSLYIQVIIINNITTPCPIILILIINQFRKFYFDKLLYFIWNFYNADGNYISRKTKFEYQYPSFQLKLDISTIIG